MGVHIHITQCTQVHKHVYECECVTVHIHTQTRLWYAALHTHIHKISLFQHAMSTHLVLMPWLQLQG